MVLNNIKETAINMIPTPSHYARNVMTIFAHSPYKIDRDWAQKEIEKAFEMSAKFDPKLWEKAKSLSDKDFNERSKKRTCLTQSNLRAIPVKWKLVDGRKSSMIFYILRTLTMRKLR